MSAAAARAAFSTLTPEQCNDILRSDHTPNIDRMVASEFATDHDYKIDLIKQYHPRGPLRDWVLAGIARTLPEGHPRLHEILFQHGLPEIIRGAAAEQIRYGDEDLVRKVYEESPSPAVREKAAIRSLDPEFHKRVVSENRLGYGSIDPHIRVLVSGRNIRRWTPEQQQLQPLLSEGERVPYVSSLIRTHLLTPDNHQSINILEGAGLSLQSLLLKDPVSAVNEHVQQLADIASLPHEPWLDSGAYTRHKPQTQISITARGQLLHPDAILHRSPRHLLQVVASTPRLLMPSLVQSHPSVIPSVSEEYGPDILDLVKRWHPDMPITSQMMDHPAIGPALTWLTTRKDEADRAAVHSNPQVRHAIVRNMNAPLSSEDIPSLLGDEDPLVAQAMRRRYFHTLSS